MVNDDDVPSSALIALPAPFPGECPCNLVPSVVSYSCYPDGSSHGGTSLLMEIKEG